MSAEQSRLRSAIQRIAREDPDRADSLAGSSARGDQPGGAGIGESDGDRDRLCCDGSVSDNANPGAAQRDPVASDGLDSDDPASVTDNLHGVVDCATGTPVCLEGADFLPPDGWDDPRTPPPDATYAEGTYWAWRPFLGTRNMGTAAPVISGTITLLNDLTGRSYRAEGEGPDQYQAWYGGVRHGYFTRYPCRAADDGESWCAPSPESLLGSSDWPEDGCVNLAIVGGSIVGSKYDPENDGSYSAPRDEIELCDPENGTSILIRPSSSGGWKSIQSLQGEPDGAVDYGYLYAKDGRRIRQISPSEFRDDTV